MQARKIPNANPPISADSSKDEVIYGVPKVTCLCATKGRYELLRSAVSYFMLQDYPNKELIIFNNHEVDIELSDFVKNQGNIHLVNAGEFSSISNVYNTALTYVDTFNDHPSEYIAIWDDDDIYLPWHLSTAVKYLNEGSHLAAQPVDQLYIDDNLPYYPKMGAISNYCEGSLVVKKTVLEAYGFGPGESDQKQHPHVAWTSKIGGSIYRIPAEESGFVYFWSDLNRGKPVYTHLQCGNEQGASNEDTGKGRPLYPGPTYFDFITKNLYLKKFNEKYTDEEKAALVDRINSYDWEFFEERKVFTFWEGEKPYFIEKCLESMERNSNCIFEVWNSDKLKNTFDDIPEEYDSLCVEIKSDYARQRILSEQGGMWLDADMFVVGDIYDSIMKYTWEYDQVQPLENPGASSINICAMACRPKSQVFQRVMKSVNAVMPLYIGWGDLLNTPTKCNIREYTTRGLVKYIDESVVSLKFAQSPHGGFSEIYSSTTIPLDEIVLENTSVVTLHSSQIRHDQKDVMPDDWLLQRLINTYLNMSEQETTNDSVLVDIVEQSISDSMRHSSNLSHDGKLPNGCPAAMTSPKIKHFFNSLFSRMPNNTNYLEIGTWEGGVLIPGLYGNDHINVSVIDIFTDPNAHAYGSAGLDDWEYHTATKETFFRNLDVYLPGRKSLEVYVKDCFEDDILPDDHTYKVYFYDGPHDKESQKKALVQYAKYMDDVFIYLVDDFLDVSVQEGTAAGIDACNFEVLYKRELFSRYNGDCENYWNGFGVFILKKRLP